MLHFEHKVFLVQQNISKPHFLHKSYFESIFYRLHVFSKDSVDGDQIT